MSLAIVEVAADGARARYALRGALTIESAAAAHACGVANLVKLPRAGGCEFDCSGIEVADSTGLAVLIEWQAEARRRGLQLVYLNLPESVLRLARLSDVETLLTQV